MPNNESGLASFSGCSSQIESLHPFWVLSHLHLNHASSRSPSQIRGTGCLQNLEAPQ